MTAGRHRNADGGVGEFSPPPSFEPLVPVCDYSLWRPDGYGLDLRCARWIEGRHSLQRDPPLLWLVLAPRFQFTTERALNLDKVDV